MTSHDFRNNIGTLRFLGAFFVLYGHSYTLLGDNHGVVDPVSKLIKGFTPFHHGLPGLGVMLFFTISGYLITASYCKRKHILDYTIARVLRIYPALIIAVVFCVFAVGAVATNFSLSDFLSHKLTWHYLFGNASLTTVQYRLPGVFADNPFRYSVNGSLWTLPVEMSMYLMVLAFGVVGLFESRYLFNGFAILLILIFVANPETFPLLKKSHHQYLGLSFLLGAFFYINRESVRVSVGLLLFCTLLSAVTYQTKFYDFAISVTFSSLVLLVGLTKRIRLPRLDKYGDYSYGLYLYAFPIQQLLIHFIPSITPFAVVVYTTILAMTCAVMSWHLVEERSLESKTFWKKRLERFSWLSS